MLCTIHGRVDANGTFLGWEQAHVGAFAFGNMIASAPQLGATPGGNAVGSTAADLVAAGEGELIAGLDTTIVFGGPYRGRVVGTWPEGADVVAGDQPIQCIDAGARPQPILGIVCWTSIADRTPLNAQALHYWARLSPVVLSRSLPHACPTVPAQRADSTPSTQQGSVRTSCSWMP